MLQVLFSFVSFDITIRFHFSFLQLKTLLPKVPSHIFG